MGGLAYRASLRKLTWKNTCESILAESPMNARSAEGVSDRVLNSFNTKKLKGRAVRSTKYEGAA